MEEKFFVRFMLVLLFLSPMLADIHISYGQEKEKAEKGKEAPLIGVMEQLKYQVISIQAPKKSDGLGSLKPEVIKSTKGTTIIWLNHTPTPLFISFVRGDQLSVTCAEPIHFVLTDNGTFQSDKIPSGGTASLCFIESGNFEYEVAPGLLHKPIATGKIIIKEK
jgi:hypothetical protein